MEAPHSRHACLVCSLGLSATVDTHNRREVQTTASCYNLCNISVWIGVLVHSNKHVKVPPGHKQWRPLVSILKMLNTVKCPTSVLLCTAVRLGTHSNSSFFLMAQELESMRKKHKISPIRVDLHNLVSCAVNHFNSACYISCETKLLSILCASTQLTLQSQTLLLPCYREAGMSL